MTSLGIALGYIMGKNAMPTNQEELLVQKAEKKINESITKINTFFSDKWKAYQSLIENSKVNIFKEFKPL
jgi:hypothetical protein